MPLVWDFLTPTVYLERSATAEVRGDELGLNAHADKLVYDLQISTNKENILAKLCPPTLLCAAHEVFERF